MNNKNNLDLSKILTDETIEIFEDIVNGPVKTGKGSYEYKIDTPPGYTKITYQEVYDMIQQFWWESKPKDNIVVYTDKQGMIDFYEELVKQTGDTLCRRK